MNTVEIALKLAIADFMAKSGAVVARSKEVGKELQAAAQAPSKDLQRVGTAGLVMGGAVAAGFALAAYTAMGFDKTMSEVQATTGATGDELGRLRQQALDAGQATVFSASEAAQAQAELAKAGVSTADILGGGLTGALDLAAAGSLDLATAAEIAANAMNQFNLGGEDVSHIADLLAAGANKSATDVTEMGMALKQGGAAAANMGIPLEETVGLLAVFAQNALKGSDGGTSMKTMLTSLAGASGPARAAIKELGLEFFDASGQFLGLENAAEQLRLKLGPLSDEQRSQALNTIFGTDAARAAIAMMEGGGEAVRQWTDDVNQSGYAAELARQKNDNLAGDLENLKGALEVALIETGSQATGVLRGLTTGLTGVVTGVGEMPGPMQTAGLVIGGVTGAASLLVGGIGTLKPKVDDLKDSLTEMGGIGKFTAGHLGALAGAAGGVGIALTAVAFVYGYYAQQEAEAEQRAKDFTDTLNEQTGALTDNTEAQVKATLESNNRMDNLQDAGLTVEQFTAALSDNTDQIMSQDEVMAQWNEGMKGAAEDNAALAGQLRARGGAMNELLAVLIETGAADVGLIEQIYEQNNAYRANQQLLRDRAIDQAIATGKTREQAEADIAAAEAAKENAEAIKLVAEAQRAATDPFYAAYSAQKQLTQAQADYNVAVRDHGSLSAEAVDAYIAVTEAGFNYENRLLGLAEAQTAGTAGVQDLAARLEGLRAYGIDPAAAAAQIAGQKFYGLALEAEAANQKNVDIPVTTPGVDDAIRKFQLLKDATAAVAGGISAGFGIDFAPPGKAAGGPVMPWSAYVVHDTRHPELLSLNDGTSMLLTGAQGGYVTNLGAGGYDGLASPQRVSAVAAWSDGGGGGSSSTTVVDSRTTVYEGDTIHVPLTSTSHSP